MEIKMAKQAKKTIKKETKATETEVLKEVVFIVPLIHFLLYFDK